MSALWRIELLGGLRAVRLDQSTTPPVSHFRTQKTAALLGYLAYHPEREHPREELLEILWPESDRDSARHKLSVALSALRAQLEPHDIGDGAVLSTGRHRVHLQSGAATTDVAEFEAHLTAAEQVPMADRLRLLQRAVELYRGRLLPGCYEEWIFPEQQRLNERYFWGVRRLLHLLCASGQLETAMQYALLATSVDPLREEAHQEVIRLHLELGHVDAAHRQYQALEKLLAEALGMQPSAATRTLLQGSATPEPDPRSAPVAPATRAVSAAPAHPRTQSAHGEAVGGAVPLDSPFYVERPVDALFRAAVSRRDSIVLLKGAAQTGKTSLLARALREARVAEARVVRTDFQLFNADRFASAAALLRTLTETIREQLDLPPQEQEPLRELGGPNLAFLRFLRREVLCAADTPLVWGLDGIDRLFSCCFGSELFEMFRSLHNERAFDPDGPWQRLTLAIAYATEAHLFITDLNRSPFNVGTRLELDDLTLEQVRDLNDRYGAPLRDRELEHLHDLTGGHPYLVRRVLHELTVSPQPFETLRAAADREQGPLSDHLRRLRALLLRDPELNDGIRAVLRGQPCPHRESFYRLRSAGILKGDSGEEARLRCGLYDTYLRQHLADT